LVSGKVLLEQVEVKDAHDGLSLDAPIIGPMEIVVKTVIRHLDHVLGASAA
jgi:hypothetical protein